MSNVRLFVTGFGPFDGVEKNPSMTLVDKLTICVTGPLLEMLTKGGISVLETSACASTKWLVEKHAAIENGTDVFDGKTLWIHIGVNGKAAEINLEKQAVNTCAFRIPDQRGFTCGCLACVEAANNGGKGDGAAEHKCLNADTPNNRITEAVEFDHPLRTTLPLDSIVNDLRSMGLAVCTSTDAGSFICNYTYFKSLEWCASRPDHEALFIHIPPFDIVPEETQQMTLEILLDALAMSFSLPPPVSVPPQVAGSEAVAIDVDALALSMKAYLGGVGATMTSESVEPFLEEYKMIMVVNTDLKMKKGKIAAQCCHAAIGAYKEGMLTESGRDAIDKWEERGCAKVVVKAPGGVEQLLAIEKVAQEKGVTTCLIVDAGRTQIAAGSTTVLGVGPAPVSVMNSITGGLKLM